MYGILLFILILLIIVVVHEFGHFIVAKYFNVRIKEFSVGFPPRIFSKQKGETKYSFGVTLLGGYVSFDEEIKDKRHIKNIPRSQQALITLAGPFFNFIFAILIFSMIFSFSDQPKIAKETEQSELHITGVVEESVAENSGLSEGIIIKNIENIDGNSPNLKSKEVSKFISENIGNELKITYTQDKESATKLIEVPESGVLGVYLVDVSFNKRSFVEIVTDSFLSTMNILSLTHNAFIELLRTGNLENLLGPIGIASVTEEVTENGIEDFLFFLAVLSISIGYINLFPLPILDGGQFLLIALEAIRKKKISDKTLTILSFLSFVVIITLFIWVSINDVKNIFAK